MDYQIIKEKGRQTLIRFQSEWGHDGIDIAINKKRRTLRVSGWFDAYVGIEGGEVPLDELVALFGKEQKR